MLNSNLVAIIGSGIMGSGIASHFANCDINVLLFDIVPEDSKLPRGFYAENAIKKMIDKNSTQLIDPSKASYIKAANLEDDLDKLNNVDFVIEAIIEDIDEKGKLYHKISKYLNEKAFICSNTSTFPLSKLIQKTPPEFSKKIIITHFFNPPRFVPLLEIVTNNNADFFAYNALTDFFEKKLGRVVVHVKDSPGFIANRVGCLWMLAGLNEAIEKNIKLEVIDYYFAKYFGIAKTGLFGLYDLIGIDLMQKINNSFISSLDKNDLFNNFPLAIEFINKMVKEKKLGRKTNEGFYKIVKENDIKIKKVLDLGNYTYRNVQEKFDDFKDLNEFLNQKNNENSLFCLKIIAIMINYAAENLDQLADNIVQVDEAMKYGFNWQFGPFEIADKIGNKFYSGSEVIKKIILQNNFKIAPLIDRLRGNDFYRQSYLQRQYFIDNNYRDIHPREGYISISDIKNNRNSVYGNDIANLWDMGKGLLLLSFNNKLGLLEEKIFEFIISITEKFSSYKAIIIMNEGEYFSVGADLKKFLYYSQKNDFNSIKSLLELGQNAMLALKYSKIPFISAISGMALGGGCELLLHSHAAQLNLNSTIGLVETQIGLIPAWGGCKEMLLKAFENPLIVDNRRHCLQILENIFNASKASSSFEAIKWGFTPNIVRTSFNKNRLLYEAKQIALEVSSNFVPKTSKSVYFDFKNFKNYFEDNLQVSNLDEHKKMIASMLIKIFTDYDSGTCNEKAILQKEKECFLELIKTKQTQTLISRFIKK